MIEFHPAGRILRFQVTMCMYSRCIRALQKPAADAFGMKSRFKLLHLHQEQFQLLPPAVEGLPEVKNEIRWHSPYH
jgi:hypothetical protein